MIFCNTLKPSSTRLPICIAPSHQQPILLANSLTPNQPNVRICGFYYQIFWISFMKTFSAKPHEVQREWFVIDAENKVLGRVAAEVASRLRGKHKPEYTPHVDTGDYIIVINADKLRVTGNKNEGKIYYRHSGYAGGIYQRTFREMQESFPGRALEKAVKGMLPKGPLGYAMIKKLKVYAGAEHQHAAQQPKVLELK